MAEPIAMFVGRDHELRCLGEELGRARARPAGGLGAGPVSQRGLARLVAHTEGVPLHLRALLEEVPAAAQDDLGQPLPAPRSYGLLVLGKVARCAPPVRELVSAVSVLGLSCPLHLAAGVAGVERPLQALEEAAREGVLLERSSPRDRDDEPAGVGRQAGGAGGAARPGRGPGGGVAGAAAARCQEPAVIGLSMLHGTTPEASSV